MNNNNVNWFEIGTDHPKETMDFYGKMFGWKFQEYTDMENEYYNIIEPGNEYPTGGILGTAGKIAEYSTFYTLVSDVNAAIADAKDNGAKVIWGPVTDKTGLTFARLNDDTGHQFGVFSAGK
ncbi:VOC family protein [Companilactobacillus furfuricola]|uniref:VOC family protein n=1 Tax=Companilactobacillus furfuricola TaxID=1462575 RepID=UPI000F7B7B41|nr:VOC family protein [Companilactobacillus furfuricola]